MVSTLHLQLSALWVFVKQECCSTGPATLLHRGEGWGCGRWKKVQREKHKEKEKSYFSFLVFLCPINITFCFVFKKKIQTPLSPILNLFPFTQDLPLSQQPQWIHGVLLQLSHPWRAMIPGLQTPLLPLTPGVLQLPVPRLPTQVTTSFLFFQFRH